MNQYIVLLRGINVGGKGKLPMKEAVAAFEKAGCEKVQSYIQSGNFVMDSELNDSALEILIHQTIDSNFQLDVPVWVIPKGEYSKMVKNNPFLNQYPTDTLHLTFLKKSVQEVDLTVFSNNDDYCISGKVVYLSCPNGYSKTKYQNNFLEKKLKSSATTRNWKTVCKMLELLKED